MNGYFIIVEETLFIADAESVADKLVRVIGLIFNVVFDNIRGFQY